MGTKITPRIPRGMRDILPQRMILRQYVINTITEVFESFGFEPLQTPAIELEETLMGKYGPDAERLIYNVAHREGKEQLSLRYDLSVPLSRVVGQYPDLLKPFKRYQIAPVWRAERPQKGRYREFYQCDADTVGSSSMLADAETLNVIYEILKRLGFRQFVTRINNRKIIAGIGQFAGVPEALLGGLYRSIDKLDKIGLEGVREELRRTGLDTALDLLARAKVTGAALDRLIGPLRERDMEAITAALRAAGLDEETATALAEGLAALLPAQQVIPDAVIARLLEFLQIAGSNREVLAQLREWLGDYPKALEGIAELEEVILYLEALDIPEQFYQVVPSMVRGRDYYTGPVYETVVEEPRIGSITGGGRYDELIGLFSERSLPATGTTIGIERIIDVMEELGMFPPTVGQTVTQVLVTRFSADTTLESLRLAQELRQAGLNAELFFPDASLGNQIRFALKKGIPYIAILGPDEIQAGMVAVRNVALEVQETVARGEVAARVKAWQEE
jgi:histidyl-tRNA synthetase